MSNHVLHVNNSNKGLEDRLYVAYLSINTMNSCSMAASCRDLEWVAIDIRVTYADSSALEDDEEAFMEFLDAARESDVLVVNSHGDPRSMWKFERLISVVLSNRTRLVLIDPSEDIESRYAHMSGLSDRSRSELGDYIRVGGEKNNLSALLWLCRNVKGYDVQVPPLSNSVQQGIYRPGIGVVKDEKGFIASLPSDRPVVAVLFHQGMWLENNLAHIDALVENIESLGAVAYPVFFSSLENPVSGSIGIDAVVKRYLVSNRKSVVDSIVMVGGFSQDTFCREGGFDNVFSQTDVPVIQANILNMTVDVWREGVVPLSPSIVSYSLAQPEFDGQIISVPLCFSQIDDKGCYSSVALEDRVGRIASLAVNWARLGLKQPGDLRLAIVLNSDRLSEGRSGTASGLDTFDSLRKLLVRLSKEGVVVGDVPKGSVGLFKQVMRASDSVSGWAEVPEGHPSIGSAIYRKWLSELPEPLGEKVVQRWGEPPASGSMSMPGVLYGTVFVGIEPERAIDVHGRVDVPSHMFCAFYQWIKGSFGADAVVHLGTRGTVEHLPGKSMALSSGCWPDVLMGSIPNLYPFATDDPGEGSVAKRRTASVLIGYLGPASSKAGA